MLSTGRPFQFENRVFLFWGKFSYHTLPSIPSLYSPSSCLQLQLACCWHPLSPSRFLNFPPIVFISLCPILEELLGIGFQFDTSLFSFGFLFLFFLLFSVYWLFISTVTYSISKVSNGFFFHNSLVLLHVLNTHFLEDINYTYLFFWSFYYLSVSSVCFLFFLVNWRLMHLQYFVTLKLTFLCVFSWESLEEAKGSCRDCAHVFSEWRNGGHASRRPTEWLVCSYSFHANHSVSHEQGMSL